MTVDGKCYLFGFIGGGDVSLALIGQPFNQVGKAGIIYGDFLTVPLPKLQRWQRDYHTPSL
jgi:hypothetical protein